MSELKYDDNHEEYGQFMEEMSEKLTDICGDNVYMNGFSGFKVMFMGKCFFLDITDPEDDY